eukprot:8438172-Alexandrium_andersonii.AAC.1
MGNNSCNSCNCLKEHALSSLEPFSAVSRIWGRCCWQSQVPKEGAGESPQPPKSASRCLKQCLNLREVALGWLQAFYNWLP